MQDLRKFYIDGRWVDPVAPRTLDVINPADEKPFATISLGSAADVDKAVAAARRAFETYSLDEPRGAARRCSAASSRSTRSASPR